MRCGRHLRTLRTRHIPINSSGTRPKLREELKYLRLVLEKSVAGEVFFGSFDKPLPFFSPTLEVIEGAIKAAARPPYSARVIVDGIDRKKAAELTNALRVRGISLEMVRSKRDESEPLIRLADMWAGCIRAAISGRADERAILDRALRKNYVRDIKKRKPHETGAFFLSRLASFSKPISAIRQAFTETTS